MRNTAVVCSNHTIFSHGQQKEKFDPHPLTLVLLPNDVNKQPLKVGDYISIILTEDKMNKNCYLRIVK